MSHSEPSNEAFDKAWSEVLPGDLPSDPESRDAEILSRAEAAQSKIDAPRPLSPGVKMFSFSPGDLA